MLFATLALSKLAEHEIDDPRDAGAANSGEMSCVASGSVALARSASLHGVVGRLHQAWLFDVSKPKRHEYPLKSWIIDTLIGDEIGKSEVHSSDRQ